METTGSADIENLSLSDVAARYGYRAETLPSGIVVLRKTYYDENDLPSVTLAEWLAAVKDIKALINAVSPHIGPLNSKTYPLFEGIKNTFTSEQFAAMQRGAAEVTAQQGKNARPVSSEAADKNGVRVANLSPAQKNEVWRVARYFYLQSPLQNGQNNLNQSETLLKSGVFFTSRGGVFGFSAEASEAAQNNPLFVGLSNPYQMPTTLQGEAAPLTEGATFIVPANDPTAPLPLKNLVTSLSVTLKQLSEQIQSNVAAGPKIMVSDALAAKRVSVAGNISRPSAGEVARAIAALYGLRVVNTQNQITIMRPRVRLTNDPAQLPTALEEMMPRPFLNAWNRTIAPNDPASRQVTLPNGTVFETNAAVTGLKWAAVRRLRQTVEPKISHAPTQEVKLSECDDREKEAFVAVLMSFVVEEMTDFIKRPVPSYITDFDQTVLVGGISQGDDKRRWFSFFLGQRMPDGSLGQGGDGFSTPLKEKP